MSDGAADVTDEETHGALGQRLVANMERMTLDRNGEAILENARRNTSFATSRTSLARLRGQQLGEGDSAIVIAAGPSVRRTNPIKTIRDSGYAGTIIATDSAIAYCLRNGVVPHLVASLDPHASRIVRWFGDPALNEDSLRADDYFRRQDLDSKFADELRVNRELLALLDRHGPSMKIALCTSASRAVAERVMSMGMEIYWWNPMLDDPDDSAGLTARMQALNRLPALNAGGNIGTACWMIAHAVLGKRRVAVTGMDFSYYADTPYSATQYYHEIVDLVGEDKLDDVFMHVQNPHTGTGFYTDPAYMWYREAFLDLASDADCVTYNCTGGGILFGNGIEVVPLDDFLAVTQ